MKYRVILYPVTGTSTAISKLLLKILGPGEENIIRLLVKNGGVVLEHPDKEIATHLADQLQNLGARVKVEEMKADDSGNPQPGPAAPISEGAEKEFMVFGKIRQADGSPAKGITARAIDRDLRSEQVLGDSVTDAEGNFNITYTSDQFNNAEKDQADLLIRAYNAVEELLGESALHFNVQRQQEISFSLPEGAVVVPSDYEKLIHEIAPLLDGIALWELTAEDIAFLVKETGRSHQEISMLAEASALAKKTGGSGAVFWGMGMQHQKVLKPTPESGIGKMKRTDFLDVPTLRKSPLEEQWQLVRGAIADNQIPASMLEEQKAFKRILNKLKSSEQ